MKSGFLYWLMGVMGFFLLLALFNYALAAPLEARWEAPTEYVDGSPLSPEEITAFVIMCTQEGFDPVKITEIDPTLRSLVVEMNGDTMASCRMKAVTGPTRSVWSDPQTYVLVKVAPLPPTLQPQL